MEGFSASTLYDQLASQSHSVTQKLSKQKEEAKSLYQKVESSPQPSIFSTYRSSYQLSNMMLITFYFCFR